MAGAATGRDGIALVVVLGFLAILAILAVSFAVTMRVERLSSNVYLHSVRARHFARVGLARARDGIDSNFFAKGWVYSSNVVYWSGGGTDEVVPALVSASAEKEAGSFIPDSVFPSATERDSPRWIDIKDGSTLIGRYAYLAVDCSGLLDANTIGATNRLYGVDPGEMELNGTLLPEVTSPATFTGQRASTWIRFETVPELGFAPGFRTSHLPQYLFPYSLFPGGYYDGTEAQPKVYVGDAAPDQAKVQAALGEMADVDAANTTLNLIDYLDADLRPGNVESFCTEPTPLINEVVVTNRITFASGKFYNQYRLAVELWYPFVGYTNTGTYRLEGQATYTVSPAEFKPRNLTFGADFSTTSGSWTYDRYLVVMLPTSGGGWASSPGTTNPPPSSLSSAQMTVSLQLKDSGGNVIDVVRNLAYRPLAGAGAIMMGAVGVTGKSADDPRINWDGTVAAQWRDSTGHVTLGALNNGVTYNTGNADGSTMMYVPNRPPQVAGELGFLLYNSQRPWQTIDLLSTNQPVLTYFTTSTNSTFTGLLNPNTKARDALASALVDEPVERYPGEQASPRRLTVAESRALATALIAKGPFVNLGNIGAIGRTGVDGAVSGLDPLQRESVIRNAAGLLSPRQNLFTVIVAGQSVVDGNQNGRAEPDEVMSEARAVAVWWRDPYASPDAKSVLLNKSFVRLFKWVGE